MKNFKFNIIVLAMLLFGLASVSNAWSGPTELPPGGNVPAPINTGTTSQSKLGSLLLNTATVNPFVVGLTVFGKTLLVNSGSGLREVLRLQHTGGNLGDGPILKFINQTNDGYGAEIGTINTQASPNYLNPALIFKVTGINSGILQERMRINPDGKVGIGKTAQWGLLDVAGNGVFDGVLVGKGASGFYGDNLNMAVRLPNPTNHSGFFAVQTNNGARNLLLIREDTVGAPTEGKVLTAINDQGEAQWRTPTGTNPTKTRRIVTTRQEKFATSYCAADEMLVTGGCHFYSEDTQAKQNRPDPARYGLGGGWICFQDGGGSAGGQYYTEAFAVCEK